MDVYIPGCLQCSVCSGYSALDVGVYNITNVCASMCVHARVYICVIRYDMGWDGVVWHGKGVVRDGEYVFMCAWMHACIYVRMQVRMDVWMYAMQCCRCHEWMSICLQWYGSWHV